MPVSFFARTSPASSAQAVDGKKYLVPRQIGTLTHNRFAVARVCVTQYFDHLLFHDGLLRHVPSAEERNELLKGLQSITCATGWWRVKAEGEGQVSGEELTGSEHERERELHHLAGRGV